MEKLMYTDIGVRNNRCFSAGIYFLFDKSSINIGIGEA
jgi:hypothetical protein